MTKLLAKDMTLRDYFAANALQGLVASEGDHILDCGINSSDLNALTNEAYEIADSMLKSR